MPEEKTDKGWAFSANSRKAHYYDAEARSLCGKWVRLFGGDTYKPETGPSPDDCAGCRRRLDTRGVK